MLEEIPSEATAAKILLDDLYTDFEARIARCRLLLALDVDFGGSGVMLPGGHPTYLAFVEARSSFVAGNFLGTILLCLALIENLLGAYIRDEELADEIHGRSGFEENRISARPRLTLSLDLCIARGLLTAQEAARVLELSELRNSLAHWRPENDRSHIDRRALDNRTHVFSVMGEDARFGITTVIKLLAKPEFAIGRRSE